MNCALILALVCFQNVSVYFYVGSQEVTLTGQRSNALTDLEAKYCADFVGRTVYAQVQIGSVIFESDASEYFSSDMDFSLTTDMATTNVGLFSIAQYEIRSVEDSLRYSGVVDALLGNWFDYYHCYSAVNVHTAFATKSVELELQKRDVCNFEVNGDAELELILTYNDRNYSVLKQALPGPFSSWPLRFQCSVDCDIIYEMLIEQLFPVVFLEIRGVQSASKTAVEIDEVGDAIDSPYTFTSQIMIRQPITRSMDTTTTNAFGDVRVRFLTILIDFYYTVFDSSFQWSDDHDKFVVQVCVNYNADFSGARFCFTQHYAHAFVAPYFTMMCSTDALLTPEQCEADLALMQNFDLNFTVLVTQKTFKGDVVVEKYPFVANYELHCYYPMTLRITQGQLCLSMLIKERCSSVSRDTEFEVAFGGYTLQNRYSFPNNEHTYCFALEDVHVRKLEGLGKDDIYVIVGGNYFPVIALEFAVARRKFDIAFAVAGVWCVCCVVSFALLWRRFPNTKLLGAQNVQM